MVGHSENGRVRNSAQLPRLWEIVNHFVVVVGILWIVPGAPSHWTTDLALAIARALPANRGAKSRYVEKLGAGGWAGWEQALDTARYAFENLHHPPIARCPS